VPPTRVKLSVWALEETEVVMYSMRRGYMFVATMFDRVYATDVLAVESEIIATSSNHTLTLALATFTTVTSKVVAVLRM